jgi:hypothetical protein
MMMTSSENTIFATVGGVHPSQRPLPRKKKMKFRRGKMDSFFKPGEAASIQMSSIANGTQVCKGHNCDLSVCKQRMMVMTSRVQSLNVFE